MIRKIQQLRETWHEGDVTGGHNSSALAMSGEAHTGAALQVFIISMIPHAFLPHLNVSSLQDHEMSQPLA